MKLLSRFSIALLIVGSMVYISCSEDALGPNELGGNTNVDYATVGSKFGSYLDVPSTYIPGLDHMYDTVVVTKNNNGIVTIHADIGFDSSFVKGLDSALGTSALSPGMRSIAIDYYKNRFGATLDTSNKAKMHASFDLKLKITSDGIQEFVNGKGDESKPFTIVKYGSKVGDKYVFNNAEGEKITRTVTYHSTTDDYAIGFWMIKVMKVEETREAGGVSRVEGGDLFIDKITYVTNHKYGLVGVIILTKTGRTIHLGVFPPTM